MLNKNQILVLTVSFLISGVFCFIHAQKVYSGFDGCCVNKDNPNECPSSCFDVEETALQVADSAEAINNENPSSTVEKKLPKKIKEIIVHGCGFKAVEEDDGVIIEIKPLPQGLVDIKGGICAEKIDPWGNLVGCKSITCGAQCKMCCGEDYFCWCQCGGQCP